MSERAQLNRVSSLNYRTPSRHLSPRHSSSSTCPNKLINSRWIRAATDAYTSLAAPGLYYIRYRSAPCRVERIKFNVEHLFDDAMRTHHLTSITPNTHTHVRHEPTPNECDRVRARHTGSKTSVITIHTHTQKECILERARARGLRDDARDALRYIPPSHMCAGARACYMRFNTTHRRIQTAHRLHARTKRPVSKWCG